MDVENADGSLRLRLRRLPVSESERSEPISDAEDEMDEMLGSGLLARGDIGETSESARSTAGNSSPEGVGDELE